MGNLGEPGSRFRVAAPNHSEAFLEEPQAFQAVGEQIPGREDFERTCIYDALVKWYGSLGDFSAHVRGAFSKEVLGLLRASGSVSSHYIILLVTPVLCLALDAMLVLRKAGAPAETSISFAFSHVVCFVPALSIFLAISRSEDSGLEIADASPLP